ncbi:MAG: tetratricopeptide repeat protein [Bacteroidota bacterium]
MPVAFLLGACSVKKNTLISRNFHQLSTHYNGWFYTNEIINTAVEKMQSSHKDNYNKILPLYIYGSIEDGKSMTSDMEKAFKKISTCIQRHSMLIRDQQYNPWIYDSYILVGKTHFYKHDYFAGLESFEYVSSRTKGKPVRYEAMLWMLRTYNETGLFSSSQGLIDLMAEQKKIPRKYLKDYYGLVADYNIKIRNYPQAVKALAKTIPLMRRGKEKARFYFVLAQLYRKTGQAQFAATCYGRAMKMTPDNEMQFQAKMKLAGSVAPGGSTKEVKKLLARMLKSEKYSDFKDQIYYALSQVHHAEANFEEEKTDLMNSVKYSQKNKNQRGMSALALANLLFETGNYPLSENYYDTAIAALPADFEDIEQIKNKKANLSALVGHIRTAQTQDSLLRLSEMGEEQRNVFIDKMIDKLKKEEERAMRELEAGQNNQNGIFTPTVSNNNQPSGATWYFYNPAALSLGFTEFIKKFGNRKLEDNWRRSNKPAVADESTQQNPEKEGGKSGSNASSGSKDSTITTSSVKTRKEYLQDIPLTPEKKKSSSNSVKNSLFNMGLIYREQLGDNRHAAEAFEKIIKKFPGDSLECICYYYLFRIYTQQGDDKESAKYKQLILDKYGQTEYAALIKNPDFNLEKNAKLNASDIYYTETFDLFKNELYDSCYKRCTVADSLFPKSENTPRYALLKAMCKGKIGGKDDMILSLKQVMADFGSHPVKNRAAEIIELLEGGAKDKKDTTAKEIYLDPTNSAQLFLMVIKNSSGDLNHLKTIISEFNGTNFGSSQLNTEDMLLGKEYKAISVKEFKDMEKGMVYFNQIKNTKGLTEGMSPENFIMLMITPDNLRILFKENKPLEYKTFFEKKYPKGI